MEIILRIIDYKVRENRDDNVLLALIVQGEFQLVKSQKTGMYYGTTNKASIPSTFDEKTFESLIVQELV